MRSKEKIFMGYPSYLELLQALTKYDGFYNSMNVYCRVKRLDEFIPNPFLGKRDLK